MSMLPPLFRVGLGLLALAVLAGCHSKPAARTLVERIGDAHRLANWTDKTAIAGDIHIALDDRPQLDMRFTYDIKTGRTRMQLADDTILVWDGQRAWVSPPTSQTERARHTLRAWPYLVLLPFMLAEAGVTISDEAERTFGGEQVPSLLLKRSPSATDTPQDWFILYADPQTHLLRGVSYIWTYGRSVEQAEQNAHAITFYRYKDFDGVRIAQEWRLWNWNREAGLVGIPIGRARIYNLDFVHPKPSAFVKPANAREDALPTGE